MRGIDAVRIHLAHRFGGFAIASLTDTLTQAQGTVGFTVPVGVTVRIVEVPSESLDSEAVGTLRLGR